MSLYNRIAGKGVEEKISPHLMTAVMNLFADGTLSGPEALGAFQPGLTTAEQTEATAIFNNVQTAVYDRSFACDIFYMAELDVAPYDTEARFKADLQY